MLGDLVTTTLSTLGITEDRVTRWLGGCCCKERREKLNALDAWARRTVQRGAAGARELLAKLIRP